MRSELRLGFQLKGLREVFSRTRLAFLRNLESFAFVNS